jgi:hypothetical protein
MMQVVQARCPHCQSVLRIPADWLDKPMRCKFCTNIFAARPRTSDTPLPVNAISAAPIIKAAVPVGRPVAAVATLAPPAHHDALVFAPPVEETVAPAARRRGTSGKMLFLGGCLLVVLFGVPIATVAVLAFGFGAFSLAGITRNGGQDDSQPHPVVHVGKDHHGKDLSGKDQAGKDQVAVVKDITSKDTIAKDGKPPKDGKAKDTVVMVTDKKGPPAKDKKGPNKEKYGPMPRRALLINVCNYLYLNRVDQGNSQTSLSALKDHGLSNAPLNIPPSQIFTLSDEGSTPWPTEITVIKNAIKDFLDSSRAQDRVVILFAGHATEIEKECYLIPIGGRKEDPDTLLPLAWVFSEMAACKAQQKVLILDVFRFPPARGFELPGAGGDEGEMGDVFDGAVQNPPAGVQVWTSCIKGQRSIEFEGGSVFLQALSRLRDGGATMSGIATPKDPLPIDDKFVAKVNDKMKELIGPGPLVQTSRLSGKALAQGPGYDPAEAAALPITLKMPAVPGGELANYADINSILGDIKRLPAVRKSKAGQDDRLLKASNLPPFPGKILATYKPDDTYTLSSLMDELRDPKGTVRQDYAKKHPLRVAVVEAIEALSKSENLAMRETLNGPLNDKQKAAFFNDQKEPGVLIFELEKVLSEMQTLAGDEAEMDKETSKRWRAHFDFTQARLKARLVYIYEYTFLLGQIRRDDMPALDNGADGWRMGSRKKIQVTEPKAKKYAKEVEKAWKAIEKNYKDTPWAILAYREGLVALGLEWKAKKE